MVNGMLEIDRNRKLLNRQQTELRSLLTSKTQQVEGLEFFKLQHSMLHTRSMSDLDVWSFEDAVFDGLNDEQTRHIPPGEEHSIAWLIWHLARIEDVTMNLLVAGTPQQFTTGGWQDKLAVSMIDTGNGMSAEQVYDLSRQVDVPVLRAYRKEVGRRTQEIVGELSPERLKEKVDPIRLQWIKDEGAVLPEGYGVIDYWGRRDIAGLLLMPPTRHCIVHLYEAYKLKKKSSTLRHK